MKTTLKKTMMIAATLGSMGLGQSAQSAVVVTTASHATDFAAFAGDTSSLDLLTGLTGVEGGTWAAPGTSSELNVNGNGTAFGGFANAAATAEVTYDLGEGAGNGWNLTSIQTFAAWGGAHSLAEQDFTIAYQPVDGGAFIDLVSASLTPGGVAATKITITEDASGVLAYGVRFVRFTNLNAQHAYRELDVEGVMVAPEPSSLALLGIGMVFLLGRKTKISGFCK